ELDKVAQEIVVDNIRQAVPSRWSRKVEELRAMTGDSAGISLTAFLQEAELDVEDVYQGGKSWSDLRVDAGLSVLPAGSHEAILRRACGRILHVDDRLRIDAYRRFLRSPTPPDARSLPEHDRRLLRMLIASIADSALSAATSLEEACGL